VRRTVVKLHAFLVFTAFYLCGCGKRELESRPPSMADKPTTLQTADNVTVWSPFTSAEGGFRVVFPVPPTEMKVQVPLGETTMYTAKKDGESYAVSWIAVRIGTRDEAEKYLEEVMETFSSLPQIRQVKRRSKLVLQDHPGREIVVQAPIDDMRIRFYYARGRLYQLNVTCKPEAIDSERLERFFESFALTQ
jgi:hypothetical protein